MIIDGHFCHDETILEMTHRFTRLTICSLCILTICNFSYFPFWGLRAEFGLLFFQFLAIALLQ